MDRIQCTARKVGPKKRSVLEELYILTVEDLMSVLPRQALSTTAIYRIVEMATFDDENLSVLPTVIVTAWARDPKNPYLVQRLGDYFQFRDTAPETIYISSCPELGNQNR